LYVMYGMHVSGENWGGRQVLQLTQKVGNRP